jgi:branched-chain amino acid aminotransferase
MASFKAADVSISEREDPLPKPHTLQFGKVFTDHMLVIEWDEDNGWHAPGEDLRRK